MIFTQDLLISSGDLRGSMELNEQMGCILGLLCCVKIKGLLYLLIFRGSYLYHRAGASVIGQVVLCFAIQTCSLCSS